MKASTDLVIRVRKFLNAIASPDKQLDDLSRSILFQVAEAQLHSRGIRVSEVAKRNEHATAPTIYGRLKKLAELDLIKSTPDHKDGRAVLLTLTPRAQRQMKNAAKEIRRVCQAQ